ncbi:hypothetical protein [Limosilactobacillus coleohominis]|uniref:hypothetical protein n=1 Tax=Limosilactobacillus coleohominis TaxID=181675 RepID=UPI001EF596F3|nr:hypothetical protein [Limosilactobacillus coleohominis]
MTADLKIFNAVDDTKVKQFDQLSNFEIAAIFKRLAKNNLRHNQVVNGGRGTPIGLKQRGVLLILDC